MKGCGEAGKTGYDLTGTKGHIFSNKDLDFICFPGKDCFLFGEMMPRVYLLTLSHAEKSPVGTKKDFAEQVVSAFKASYGEVVEYWCVSVEPHEEVGFHYHMAVKLKRSLRFNGPRKVLAEAGLRVNFTEPPEGAGYFHAFQYVTKEDRDAIKSIGHPEEVPKPRTERASTAARRRSRGASRFIADGTEALDPLPAEEKPHKLNRSEFAEKILECGIKDYQGLEIEAEKRRRQGDPEMWTFAMNRGQKIVEETIAMANSMARSIDQAVLSQRSRLQVLQEVLTRECECPESGLWQRMASQTLELNDVKKEVFCAAVVDLLRVGRSKGRNLFLVGQSNCGKSFLLKPLQKIYACFCSPAFNPFSFSSVKDKQVIFLDDFRFNAADAKPIPWTQMLNLLDGSVVNLSRPRTHFADDYCLEESNTIPVFATGIAVPIHFVGGVLHEGETEMMRNRFRVFVFERPATSIRECPACVSCFATLLRSWDSTKWE